ncbi:hypothetical protein FACS1894187_13600 [Synergistales bacterium]|nr:hypothetical protein FACS1894187_13600 [Synergistales bacterium]
MTNDALQVWALQLNSEDSSIRTTAKERIADYELGWLKNLGGKAYFPLLKRFNGAIPFNDFYDIFIDVLMGLFRNYNPEKGTFVTAMSWQLNNRIKDYFAKLNKEKNIKSLDAHFEILGEAGESAMNPDFDTLADEEIETRERMINPGFDVLTNEKNTEIAIFVRFASLVAERKKAEEHLGKSKSGFFSGFFTFDITKALRIEELISESEVVSENNTLYPAVDTSVTDYLLIGFAASMRDVARSPLKDVKLFDKRQEVIGKCYGISKPTVITKNRDYYQQFIQACVG